MTSNEEWNKDTNGVNIDQLINNWWLSDRYIVKTYEVEVGQDGVAPITTEFA